MNVKNKEHSFMVGLQAGILKNCGSILGRIKKFSSSVRTGSGVHSAFCSTSTGDSHRRSSGWDVKLTGHHLLVSRLRMCGAVPPFKHFACGMVPIFVLFNSAEN